MADTIASALLMVLSDRLNSLDAVLGGQIWRKMRLTLQEIQTLVEGAEKLSEKLSEENKLLKFRLAELKDVTHGPDGFLVALELLQLHFLKNMVAKVSEENKALNCWLTEVKDVAYDADDFLDEFELFLLKNKVEKKVMNFFSRYKPLAFHFKLQHKLRKIESRLDQLVQHFQLRNRSFFSLKAADLGVNSIVDRRTVYLVDESGVFGREDDREMIVDWLLDESEAKFSVVSIVGMGGIGKTTLAQLAYNDDRVVRNFNLRLWICVSEEFDVNRIVKEILQATTLERHDISSLDLLGRELNEVLCGKRFLIVLDDVWNENHEKWSMLTMWFSVGALGSKVLLTTRSARVAALSGPQYFLRPLSDEDSWSLFIHRVFSGSQFEKNSNLEEIGRKIVAKCQGLPLAIETLGSLLRFKEGENEWLSILEEDIWSLPESGQSLLPVLRLSYDHLPSDLKQCFAFCSVFPKDYTINKKKLIHWWIANGFIPYTRRVEALDEIGNNYFELLLERSFFIEVARDEYGSLAECRMHHLIHDLAQSVAGTWCSVVETGIPQRISNELRHLSFVGLSGPPTIPEALHQARNLRTFVVLSGKFGSIPSIFQLYRCLRVLDLSHSGLRELPVSVGHLIHLRYLDLSCTYIEMLPRSIRKLKNLQTLELFGCFNLQELPKAISDLTNLRHLGIQSCPMLLHMPFGIGKLRLLQTLPTFILGKTDGCGCLGDLSGLNLSGRLEIKNLEHVSSPAEANDAKLYDKLSLYSLGLSWGHNLDTKMSAEVLESLRPSCNLKVLDIIGYGNSMFPSWLWDSSLTLVKLTLINCSCQALPPLGQLPYLRDLHMKGLSEVQIIGHEFYGDHIVGGFQSLKQLELYDMPNLLEWRNFKLEKKINLIEIEESSNYLSEVAFPCLDTLSIKGCTKLTNLPLLPYVCKLALSNCNLMLLESLAHLTSLYSLVIDEFREPMFLSLNLGGLNCIRTLTIYDCNDLIFLLEEDMQGLASLEHLSILCCDKLKSLPMGLRYLTSLQKLVIVECQELVDIPDIMSSLSFLQELIIEDCPNLESLADSVQSLTTRFQKVVIQRCPKLEMKLHMDKGAESSKTVHIPFIDNEIGEFVFEEDNYRKS